MKEIVLFCQYGASTGILADAMVQAAGEMGVEANINAYSEYDIDTVFASKHPDVILLGPQVRHKLNEFKEKYGQHTAILAVDPMDYGMANGKKVLEYALENCK